MRLALGPNPSGGLSELYIAARARKQYHHLLPILLKSSHRANLHTL